MHDRLLSEQSKPDVLEKVVVIPDGMPLIDLTVGVGVWVRDHINVMCAKVPSDSLVIIVIDLPFEMLKQVEGLNAWTTGDQPRTTSITVHSSTTRKILYRNGPENGLEVHLLAADAGQTLIRYSTSTTEVVWASLITSFMGLRYDDLATGVRRPFNGLLQRLAAISIQHSIALGLQLTATTLKDVLDNER